MQLMFGDCLERMREIPDGSVDLVLTDPPYGTTACKWDSVIPFELAWNEVLRVLSPIGTAIFTSSQPFTSMLGASMPDLLKYSLVWAKSNATGHAHAKNKPMKKHEDVMVFSKGVTVHACQTDKRMTYNPQGVVKMEKPRIHPNNRGSSVLMDHRSSHRGAVQEYTGYPTSIISIGFTEKRVHPTQKPVALMEYLIRTYTNEGETVLDFTMGSGTTGVACVNAGRKFIGIERDEGYFAIAEKRITEAMREAP